MLLNSDGALYAFALFLPTIINQVLYRLPGKSLTYTLIRGHVYS